MIKASDNEVLAQTLTPLIRKTVLLTQLNPQDSREASLLEHAQILTALRHGDCEEAAWQLATHLRNSLRRNRDALGET